jgi:hypothetical protein
VLCEGGKGRCCAWAGRCRCVQDELRGCAKGGPCGGRLGYINSPVNLSSSLLFTICSACLPRFATEQIHVFSSFFRKTLLPWLYVCARVSTLSNYNRNPTWRNSCVSRASSPWIEHLLWYLPKVMGSHPMCFCSSSKKPILTVAYVCALFLSSIHNHNHNRNQLLVRLCVSRACPPVDHLLFVFSPN